MKVSASIGAAGLSVAGSYSKDFMEVISEQRNSSTVTARTKYFDHRYTLLANSRCPLDDKFKLAATDLLEAIAYDMDGFPEYLSQTIVEEYGTHFVSKVKIGGEIYSDDYINDNYWNKMKNTSTTFQTSASLNFVDTFQVGGSFNAGNTVCLNQIFFKENNY